MNKILEMTKNVITLAEINNMVLVRIDTQFNYKTYKWTAIGYTADNKEIRCTENNSLSVTVR